MAHGKLLERFVETLDKVSAAFPESTRESHGLRDLDRRRYFSLFLLGLFNPVVDSMRGLCQASTLPKAQDWVGLDGPVVPSQFSAAQQVFAPDVLRAVMQDLLKQSAARQHLVNGFGRLDPATIRIVDSTLWKVIPRMHWAHWRFQNIEQKALRFHVQLRMADLQVAEGEVTEGKGCERAALKRSLEAGAFYLGDRYYGESYELFDDLVDHGCGFVIRLCNKAVFQVIKEHEIDPRAAADTCTLDAEVTLGARASQRKGPWRLISFQRSGMKEPVLLLTNVPPETLSTHEVMELYRCRWMVEMFFRWLKCLVPCRHWFAESREGVTIQIYLCLIQALLLAEALGHKPNKRQMELLRWYQLGIASEEELAKGLIEEERKRRREAERRSAKKISRK